MTNLDTRTRTIYFIDEVTQEGAAEFVKNIRTLDRTPHRPIKVILSTEGGDVDAGILMYQSMKLCKSKIIIEAFGQVESIGVLLLQAGHRRIVGPMTTLMDHEGAVTATDLAPDEAYQTVEAYRQQFDTISDEIYERVSSKSKITRKEFDTKVRSSYCLSGTDIVDAGYADEVRWW